MPQQSRNRRKVQTPKKSAKRRQTSPSTPQRTTQRRSDSRMAQGSIEELPKTAAPVQKRRGHRSPKAGESVLATYIDTLSHFPLFTQEQEIAFAKDLAAKEIETWRLILSLPRGASLIGMQLHQHGDPISVRKQIDQLIRGFRQSPPKVGTQSTAQRKRKITLLATALCGLDPDKEWLTDIMKHLRRDVTRPLNAQQPKSQRVQSKDVLLIEQAHKQMFLARNNFVRANLRLVVSVARKFRHDRLPLVDLIQEGNVGLMKAIHRFDHQRGFRFSTYAHWWIRQSVERAIVNKGSQVRLPVHVRDVRRKIGRAKDQLQHDFDRPPTHAEIAHHLQLSEAKVTEVLAGVQPNPVSLDEPFSQGNTKQLLDVVHDDNVSPVDISVINADTHAQVRQLMSQLGPMETNIIQRRFGLGNDEDQTLDEIGQDCNLSRERVRQIQTQGLLKMRRMCERRSISTM